MNRPDSATATTRQALAYVARQPGLWLPFVVMLARFSRDKVRFYLRCWRAGYRVSTVRRLAREAGR